MENENYEMTGWERFVDAVKGIYDRIAAVVGGIGMWIFRLRKIFMALPVLYTAWRLAVYSSENLPDVVGFDIQATGEFAQMISRNTAVYGPLGLTCVCLILMFCSRRTVYPWLISIFSLTLPILILALNVYLV